MAKLRLTSVVFFTKFIFAKKSVGNVKHCTILRGFQKGDRNPTSVVAGEGSQGEGESKHPLPVRVFGDGTVKIYAQNYLQARLSEVSRQ